MSFKTEDKTINALFIRNIFSIPRHQRRYVWDRRNWEELFEDISFAMNNHTSHFIGSFVLKDEGIDNGLQKYTIIDGQQRIITLSIILSSILFWLRKDGRIDDFEGTKQYVFAKDNKAKDNVVILSDYHMSLERIIKALNSMNDEEFKKISIETFLNKNTVNKKKDKNILDAFKYFLDKIKQEKETSKDQNYLIGLRDGLLNMAYISIISSTDEDSYTIFEILNARGIALEDHELLKNYIMRYIQPETSRDIAKSVWIEIENELGNNISKFVKHYTIHKCANRPKELTDYKIIQQTFKKKDAEELLYDLKKKSEYYSKILNPQDKCENGSVEQRVLSFFRKKRQEQLRPVLLSIIDQHEVGNIEDKVYDKLLNFIYNFYVCYNIIGEESSNKLTYVVNKYAELFENEYKDDLIQDFTAELKRKLPTESTFKNAFKNVGYSKNNNFYEGEKNKDRVQTVLEVLERYNNNGICMEGFSIEHVLDDSLSDENGQIGNLIPLEESNNGNANRKKYESKIDIYKKSNYITARKFAERFPNESGFNPSNRTEYLAKVFYDNILKFE